MGLVVNMAVNALNRSSGPNGTGFFVVMLACGMYVTFGRFLVDLWLRRRTRYWVTNQRVVIQCSLFRPTITSMSLQHLPFMLVTERGDGFGTIRFGEPRAAVGD
jgi:hypothetical protein